MLYTPIPGTALHAEHAASNTLLALEDFDEADIHGQLKFNYKHPHIKNGQESEFVLNAFQRDFETNGPSVLRIARTTLEGWRRYKNYWNKRIRDRYAYEARELWLKYAGALWAARKWFKNNTRLVEKITTVLNDIKKEFGFKARLAAPLAGRVILSKIRTEDKQLREGLTYEPPTYYEANKPMISLRPKEELNVKRARWVNPFIHAETPTIL
jgi:hypothetical protein